MIPTMTVQSLDERIRERARDAWTKKVGAAFTDIDSDIGLSFLPGASGLYNIHGTELSFGAAVYALKCAAQQAGFAAAEAHALERHLRAVAKMGGDDHG